MTIEDFDF